MTAALIPAATAMARFFPDGGDLYDCFSTFVGDGEAAIADGLIDQGATGEAREVLDTIAPEIERHLSDHHQWLTQSRERIARRRAKLA